MKKILCIAMLMVGLWCTDVLAQERAPVFSASLGGGSSTQYRANTRRTLYTPTGRQTVVAAKPKAVTGRKTIIKYDPNQVSLTPKQREELVPMLQRLQEGRIRRMEIVGIAPSYNTVYHRQAVIGNIIKAYNPQFKPNYRYIVGSAVLPSNIHTVEIIEYQ